MAHFYYFSYQCLKLNLRSQSTSLLRQKPEPPGYYSTRAERRAKSQQLLYHVQLNSWFWQQSVTSDFKSQSSCCNVQFWQGTCRECCKKKKKNQPLNPEIDMMARSLSLMLNLSTIQTFCRWSVFKYRCWLTLGLQSYLVIHANYSCTQWLFLSSIYLPFIFMVNGLVICSKNHIFLRAYPQKWKRKAANSKI